MDPNIQTSPSVAPLEAIPTHVQQFFILTEALDQEVRRKPQDPIAITRCRAALKQFYLTLDGHEQSDIQGYIDRDTVGEAIENQRGRVMRGVVNIMHLPHQIVGAAVEPVARFAGKTSELVFLTLGWTARGAVQGVKTAFKSAA